MTNSATQTVSVARGAALVIALRWTDRLLGIVSTLVLARLLVPADFGIIAMASLVVLLIDTLLDLGVNAALVQNRSAGRDDYDTAWTLRLAQCALAALVVVATAPFAAGYFNDGRVEAVLWVMSLSVMAAGFENIGIVSFQKDMAFGREFKFFFLRRLAGFLITLGLALLLRNYWAMVIGTLGGRLIGVGLSYGMHPFRPRFSLSKIRSIWSFSQWMFVRNLGTFGAQNIDKLVLGRRAGASELGTYNLADDIAAMPVTELLAPIGRVLFPAFVNAANDPITLRRSFNLAFGLQILVGLPAGVGLALVAETAVPLLLGEQWIAAVPLLQVLALISIATALTHSSGYILLALGKVKLQAFFAWGQFLLLAALLLMAYPQADSVGIAHTRLGVAVLAMLMFLAMVLWAVPILRVFDMMAASWRPILATGVMATVLLQVNPPMIVPLGVRFVVDVVVGGGAYMVTLSFLWWLAGKPDGPEGYLLKKIKPKLKDNTSGQSSTLYKQIDELPEDVLKFWQRASSTKIESSPAWFDNLQHSVFSNDPGIRYAVLQQQGICEAVLPLRYTRHGVVRRLEALTNFYTSLYAPPFAPSTSPKVLADLLKNVLQTAGATHEIRFAPMDPAGTAYHQLQIALRQMGWVPYTYFCFGNWQLKVSQEWPDYFASLPGQVRSTIKRMGKKFIAVGGTLEIVQTKDGLEESIAAYVDVYTDSWKVPEPYPEFIPGLIRLLASHGWLRLGIARLAGRPIAVQLWIVQGARAAIFKLAHREDSTDYSAGTLLTARLMEHVMTIDHVREVDYLIGDDAYKKNWMNQRQERWGIVAYNPKTFWGLLLLLRERLARIIKTLKEKLNKWNFHVVRQAHHERNQ